jgi:MFS family permease
MISDFGVAPTEDDVGEYAGYLVASFMLGQLLCSFLWGCLSDRYGRRPVLLIGLLLTAIAFASFGFSKTYQMAMILRFVTGAVNGIVGVCKTYMSEITDSTNQAKGFGYFGVSRGMGLILGPIVGGFLCLPSKKYPSIFPAGSLFDLYPYALPCVIGALIAVLGFVLGFAVISETNKNASEKPTSDEETPLLSSERPTDLVQRKNMFQLFREKKVFFSLFFYFVVTFVFIQFDELFALWSRLSYEEGGLQFDSSMQGSAYAIGGVVLFFYQLFLFSIIEKRLGTLNTFRTGVLVSIPSFILLPMISQYFLRKDGSNEWSMWFMVGLCQVLRAVGGVQAFTSTFILISNSVASRYRGSINGVGQTLASLSRVIGPIFGGSLFSWSLENHIGFPFNYYFVFLLLGIFLTVLLFISFQVDQSMNERVQDEEQ